MHGIESLYETFEPQRTSPLAARLEFHYTPKHGSWLNILKIERGTLRGQRLDHRIPSLPEMRDEVAAWVTARGQRRTAVNWKFRTEDARIKLTSPYPTL